MAGITVYWSSQRVQNELLLAYENQLLEKENSGFRVLLKDDKVYFFDLFESL